MKKIAIVTIVDYNYGNRLQNYAVQEVLKDLGLSPQTLRFSSNPLRLVNNIIEKYFIKNRKTNFRLFNDHIKWSKHSLQDKSPGKYDYYIIGSDQVWNAEWFDKMPWRANAFLLTFAPTEKRICFSPSFGTNELPEKWKPLFREQLSKFGKISVREDAGAAIIKELTGKDAEVLIDPTCMLDTDKWMKIAKAPKGFDSSKPYILTYFLGGRSDRVNQDLQKYANEYDLRVCNLLDMVDKDLYFSGPSEFIWLIANAKLVLTDSFHACVFSFLFQKPFLVYTRDGTKLNMLSRMETLLEKFDLTRKYIDSGLPNDLFECDYQKGYRQLEKEREKVKRFLLESLGE